MAFVIDASIAASWAFPDERHPAADLVFAQIDADEAIVPSLWWYEVRNILVVNERRGRITERDTVAFLRSLSAFFIRTDHHPGEVEVLRLARTHRLTVYDAAYIELAARAAVSLATLDEPMAKAARLEGIPLIGG